jgi:hypothetical protein
MEVVVVELLSWEVEAERETEVELRGEIHS